MRKQPSQPGVQSQSFCLRYKHWERMRQRQIQKIKDKIRKMYAKQQEQTQIYNEVSEEDKQIKLAVQQFRNKLILNNQISSCKICLKRDQMEDKNEGMLRYLRYNKSFCTLHEKQVIEDSIRTFRDKPIQIIKLYEEYELQGQNIVQIKRVLSFICYLLASTSSLNYEILSNFNIISLIADGWFQYWIEELHSQENFKNNMLIKLKYLVKESKRLMIMCRLLNFHHDQSWKLVHEFISSLNAPDQLIGYDWVLGVLSVVSNSSSISAQETRVSVKMEKLLMKQIYEKDFVNDFQSNSEVMEMKIQISDKYLCLRLNQSSSIREQTQRLMEKAKRWFKLMKRQVNVNQCIIQFSEYTHQCMLNIQYLLNLTQSNDENEQMSECMEIQIQ